jgi:hypothetical protein
VQTGLDQLEVLQLLADQTSAVHQQLLGGRLTGLGQGRWYFHLAQPVRVNAFFTGCY